MGYMRNSIDSWPPGGEDEVLSELAGCYLRDNQSLDLAGLLSDDLVGKVALVSSFGAESAVLLHMVCSQKPDIDVLFIDTGHHFPETLNYVQTLSESLSLRNLHKLAPDPRIVDIEDPKMNLWESSPSTCCTVRKTFPLEDILVGFDSWITGRKRYHGGDRSHLPFLERSGKHIKINPLVNYTSEMISEYIERHALPQHPLSTKGYFSVGCLPCTVPSDDPSDPRAGRWYNQMKTECGIHLGPDGRFSR